MLLIEANNLSLNRVVIRSMSVAIAGLCVSRCQTPRPRPPGPSLRPTQARSTAAVRQLQTSRQRPGDKKQADKRQGTETNFTAPCRSASAAAAVRDDPSCIERGSARGFL